MDAYGTIAFVIVISVIMLIIVIWSVKREKAIRKVLDSSTNKKIDKVNDALKNYGFYYDYRSDVISSRIDAWQRNVGYCSLYDELTPSFNMIIDCEPIYFNYDNKRWLIEFWKGQYGMTTGGEVGIYYTDKDDINIPGLFSGPFFKCVNDEDLLNMKFEIKKNDSSLFEMKGNHWWLTGFDVGIFSNPKTISMDIKVEFPKKKMQNAFLDGLRERGYEEKDYKVVDRKVIINFNKPKHKQPYEDYKLLLPFIQLMNNTYCKLYNLLTNRFDTTIDKIYFLSINHPILFRFVTEAKRLEKIQRIYNDISSFLDRGDINDNEHL